MCIAYTGTRVIANLHVLCVLEFHALPGCEGRAILPLLQSSYCMGLLLLLYLSLQHLINCEVISPSFPMLLVSYCDHSSRRHEVHLQIAKRKVTVTSQDKVLYSVQCRVHLEHVMVAMALHCRVSSD